MQAKNNLTVTNLGALHADDSVGEVEVRFLHAFTDAIQRRCKTRIEARMVFVQVEESLWLAVCRHGGLYVYKKPDDMFEQVHYQVWNPELIEFIQNFISSANYGKLDGILHSIGR